MSAPWSVKNRTRLFWQSAGTAREMFGWKGWFQNIWHNLRGPSTGCSCTFCFYSKRRKFPPGHPMHPTQIQATLEKKFDQLLQDIRIQRDERHRRAWGGE